jgi:hypothetical protein
MKKQRTIFTAFMLLFIAMPMLQSCLDNDWDNQYPSLFAIGTIKVIEENDYYFTLDEGSKLYPGDTTALYNYTVVDGQRAFVYFDELSEKKEGYEYNAQIKHIENILTKDIYFMPADKEDSIGDDRINIIEPLWITGDFLNIKYQIYHGNNKEKLHMLNLVINEEPADENDKPDYLNLEFRHNAYNDNPEVLGTGLASFRLNNIADLLEGKKGLNIRVRSIYDGVKHITLDFKEKEE